MQHRKLGKSDLQLPVITFGAWAIGGLFWGGNDDNDAIQAIHAALDNGITAIDTAPAYGSGHSEVLVGKAIAGRRDQVKILTKCGLRWDDTSGEFHFNQPAPDGSSVTMYKNVRADSIFYECEQSLKRLGLDVIDLYQVHWPSATAPAQETMGALVRLREQGKIRQIGVCNYSGKQVTEAAEHAPVASNQIKYNLLDRDIEKDALPLCRELSIGVICYSPMALGLLTGAVTMDRQFSDSDIRVRLPWYQPANRRRVLDALESIRPIAQAHQATLGQLAVAWVLAQGGITTALVGARNAKQATENAAAANVKLSAQELAAIRGAFEAIGPPQIAGAR
jgi:aryl-alcohol dehydrogenase-like predicted oxidoreductase